eukprot:m.200442 g.200442  ORF g.200442 m.200442 type:complete len:424 (-) comp14959_c1_seq7:452-1723(-)
MHTHNARSDDNSVGTLFLMLHCFDSIQALAKRVRELETQLERYRHLDAHPSSAVTSRTPVASAATDPAKPKASTQRSSGKRKQKSQKQFDYSQHMHRKIAIKFAYLGEKYHGLARQDHVDETIEAHLLHALNKACLMEDVATADMSRCGRTDKGVSAFSQVISLKVRTNVEGGPGFYPPTGTPKAKKAKGTPKELPYVQILNGLLPDDIRVYAWARVDDGFSARFSCGYRSYKYFFPRESLNIQAMREAAAFLVGEHDFRNLCKPDVAGGITNYMRTIISAEIVPMQHSTQIGGGVAAAVDEHSPFQMYELRIQGRAFLWHQIRCIMAVLLLVGEEKETPQIVQQLLDIEATPAKPQYTMAHELPVRFTILGNHTYNPHAALHSLPLCSFAPFSPLQTIFGASFTTHLPPMAVFLCTCTCICV